MNELSAHLVETNGVRLHLVEAGKGPLVLLLHGFPESWYSYRHTLLALAEAGFHAAAPDQRGYGESDRPDAIEAYDQIELAADAAGLIAALGHRDAVVVGHDWGAPVAWHTALLHPDRVRAVVGASIPYGGRPKQSPMVTMRNLFDDRFFYMLYFQEPGRAEAELEKDVRRSLRILFHGWSGEAPPGAAAPSKPASAGLLEGMPEPERPSAWLSSEDLDYYTSRFERSGFSGPLNWYRNFDRTFIRTASLDGARISQPALFIAGERDPALIMMSRARQRMAEYVPKLQREVILPKVGHWTQQEASAAFNDALIAFLRTL
jgi:pimeloyl-ACP methyl ester carboxylesterase